MGAIQSIHIRHARAKMPLAVTLSTGTLQEGASNSAAAGDSVVMISVSSRKQKNLAAPSALFPDPLYVIGQKPCLKDHLLAFNKYLLSWAPETEGYIPTPSLAVSQHLECTPLPDARPTQLFNQIRPFSLPHVSLVLVLAFPQFWKVSAYRLDDFSKQLNLLSPRTSREPVFSLCPHLVEVTQGWTSI